MTIQEGAHGGQVVEAGGRLLLALPVGGDLVRYNMHRVYGPLRLPLLLENWTVLGAQGFDAAQLSQVSWPLVCHFPRSSRPFRPPVCHLGRLCATWAACVPLPPVLPAISVRASGALPLARCLGAG